MKAARVVKAAPTHADGPAVPPALLGELRASWKRYTAAMDAVNAFNAQAASIQREATSADAVHRHFVEQAKAQYHLVDGDLIDLERGVIRRQVRPASRTGN